MKIAHMLSLLRVLLASGNLTLLVFGGLTLFSCSAEAWNKQSASYRWLGLIPLNEIRGNKPQKMDGLSSPRVDGGHENDTPIVISHNVQSWKNLVANKFTVVAAIILVFIVLDRLERSLKKSGLEVHPQIQRQLSPRYPSIQIPQTPHAAPAA